MEKEQLENLLRFTVLYTFGQDVYWYDYRQDYMIDSWDKYIGINEFKVDIYNFKYPDEFERTWAKKIEVHIQDNKSKKIKIIYFILSLLEKELNSRKFRFNNIIDIYDNFINIENVIKIKYRNLDFNLETKYRKFYKRNIRYINLTLLLR